MTSLLAFALISNLAAADAPPLMTGIGELHRPVATTNSLAQKYFDQGLTLFYAFH